MLQKMAAAPAPDHKGGKRAIALSFAGLAITLDRSGAAFVPGQSTLIVSDLHLEKGSGAAARGRLLPALDSRDTIQRLKRTIGAYRPERVVCLGDSFHDPGAGGRMAAADREELSALCASVREWVWIGGNHDPEVPHFCGGEARAEYETGGIILRHEPALDRASAQIAGHLHPKFSVSAGGYRVSGRCFCVSPDLLIMPAFGAYAGGLRASAPEFGPLHKSNPKIFMLHASKLWRVA